MVKVATSPARMEWLRAELRDWQGEGLVGGEESAAILDRYTPVRRVTLGRVVLVLGALFVGVGLIWFVAVNLDRLERLGRLGLMVLLWGGLLVLAEWFAAKRRRIGDPGSPLAGALRLLAAGAFGAVAYQLADVVDPGGRAVWWLGLWAAGALVHGYAASALTPTFLGASVAVAWFLGQAMQARESLLTAATTLLVAGLLATALAVLHAGDRRRGGFTFAWGTVGAAATLGGAFLASIPFDASDRLKLSPWVVGGAVVAVAAAVTAAVRGPRERRLDLMAAAGALVLGSGLAAWGADDSYFDGEVSAGGWLRAVVAVAYLLAVAGAVMAVASVHDDLVRTVLATVAILIGMTFQAAAVFAPILSGGLLFIVVGAVLITAGVLADRGRRRLRRRLEPDADHEGRGA